VLAGVRARAGGAACAARALGRLGSGAEAGAGAARGQAAARRASERAQARGRRRLGACRMAARHASGAGWWWRRRAERGRLAERRLRTKRSSAGLSRADARRRRAQGQNAGAELVASAGSAGAGARVGAGVLARRAAAARAGSVCTAEQERREQAPSWWRERVWSVGAEAGVRERMARSALECKHWSAGAGLGQASGAASGVGATDRRAWRTSEAVKVKAAIIARQIRKEQLRSARRSEQE
jgi:hypothetical protein